MQEWLEVEELVVDEDGDIGVRAGEVGYWARLRRSEDDPHIEVFTLVLTDVEPDPGLYEALNEINRGASHVHAFFSTDAVVIAGELVGETADERSLGCLCREVVDLATKYGPELQAVFGGKSWAERGESK